jgi:hypothetical protein
VTIKELKLWIIRFIQLIIFPILIGYCNWESIEAISRPQMIPGEPTPLVEYLEPLAKWERVQYEIFQALLRQIKKVNIGTESKKQLEHKKLDPSLPIAHSKTSVPIMGALITDSTGTNTVVHPETGILTSGDFSAVEDAATEYALEIKKVPFLAVTQKDKLHSFAQRLQANNQFEKKLPRSVAIIYRLFAAALLLSKSENMLTPIRQCLPWLQRSIEHYTEFKDNREIQASQAFLNEILVGQIKSVNMEIFTHHCFRVAMVEATEEEVKVLSKQAVENIARMTKEMEKL